MRFVLSQVAGFEKDFPEWYQHLVFWAGAKQVQNDDGACGLDIYEIQATKITGFYKIEGMLPSQYLGIRRRKSITVAVKVTGKYGMVIQSLNSPTYVQTMCLKDSIQETAWGNKVKTFTIHDKYPQLPGWKWDPEQGISVKI